MAKYLPNQYTNEDLVPLAEVPDYAAAHLCMEVAARTMERLFSRLRVCLPGYPHHDLAYTIVGTPWRIPHSNACDPPFGWAAAAGGAPDIEVATLDLTVDLPSLGRQSKPPSIA